MAPRRELVHATALALAGRAALIIGPSGSGKSDLALRCLGLPPTALLPELPALLISDDQVLIEEADGGLAASAPVAIRGKLEVRGVGIVDVANVAPGATPVALVADIRGAKQGERLPDPWPRLVLLGIEVPVLYLTPFEASAPLKLLLALSRPTG